MKAAWLAVAVVAWANEPPRYEKDILPIFTKYCFTCHGQSSAKLGLDLRTAASALRGSHNGAVIAKGDAAGSLLFKKISARQMPPPIYGQTVPDGDIELVKQWIDTGAAQDTADRPAVKVPGVIVARCAGCHGASTALAGLRLHTMADVLKGSSNGPVVVEGFSDRSLLVRRVANQTMPPKGAGAPLTAAEISAVREWIDRGEFGVIAETNPADRPFSALEDPPLTGEQRRFWAFQKPKAPRAGASIDSLVQARLVAKGLAMNPPAPMEKLVRRVYLDLTGLPPSPAELAAFRKHGSYERLVDELLASPRCGERWGRQWLDAAGYVDTTGKDFDPKKAEYAEGMWRYRDYVIKAFNEDKPWNRFLTEQIAGDELVDWREAPGRTPETIELLAATGYLRTILDITHEEISNLPVERYEALFKLVEKVGSSTLGLTVNCARCHSHKFDPISQKDYYRFLALFTTAYNPTDWIRPQFRHLYTVPKAEQERIEKSNRELELSLREKLLGTVPEVLRNDVKKAFETVEEKRNEVQKYLFGKFNPGLQKEFTGHEKYGKLEPIQAMWDVGAPPRIRLLQRGSAEAPGPGVQAGFPQVLSSFGITDAAKPKAAAGKTSGMRLALAEWLTHPEHPLTARVIVNRIWQGHFGTGLVATPDNFGASGARPSNPELLDFLAVEFERDGWSAKKLHRKILLSKTYRQSGAYSAKAAKVDPDNTLLWRKSLMRLDAEALRDSVLAAAGVLDTEMGGPPIPLEMKPDGLQVVAASARANAKWRRSIYLTHRRTYPMSFLGVFDYPVIDTNCTLRVPSATPLQSLTMLNDTFLVEAAEKLAARAQGSVAAAYEITLGRKPEEREEQRAAEFLKSQPFRALAQALLSSNEFLYVD